MRRQADKKTPRTFCNETTAHAKYAANDQNGPLWSLAGDISRSGVKLDLIMENTWNIVQLDLETIPNIRLS